MRMLLSLCLVCFAIPLRADELTDLKVQLAIAEVRAQRLESMLQANVQPETELQPEVPDLTPEPVRQPPQPRYVTRQVTKYRSVRVKHCNGRRCWYTTEQQPYTVTEQVLVEQPIAVPIPSGGWAGPFKSMDEVNRWNQQSADQYSTPLDAGNRILSYLKPTSRQTLLDLGSGDGRMVVEWARWTGYPAIGIESDPYRVAQSHALAERKGVSHLVTFIEGDFTKIAWPAADVIYLYQFPDVMAEVSDRLKHYDRVVSFSHEVPGLAMQSHNGGEFYSWRKPQPVRSRPVAYWNGRAYTAPVCNKPGCTMCATIRAQLGM